MEAARIWGQQGHHAHDPDDAVVVTLARPPSAIAIVKMARDLLAIPTSAGSAGGRGLARDPASPTPYGFVTALASGGQDKPLVALGVGFAAPTDQTWLDPRRTTPFLPRASRGDTQEAAGRRSWRRAFGG